MKLIIGLGNPGPTYARTWHNAGFLALDELNRELGGGPFKEKKKFPAMVAEVASDWAPVILAKPQTFMNQSGRAVGALLRFYRLTPDDLWVLHDDLDLPLGSMRVSVGASAAGHRGVQSIIAAIGSQEFTRFRIGIQSKTPRKVPAEAYVLKKISLTGTVKLRQAIGETVSAIELALTKDIAAAMNRFN